MPDFLLLLDGVPMLSLSTLTRTVLFVYLLYIDVDEFSISPFPHYLISISIPSEFQLEDRLLQVISVFIGLSKLYLLSCILWEEGVDIQVGLELVVIYLSR